MEILSLALYNFRNFSSKKIVFDKDLTVIIGPNGSGKINILVIDERLVKKSYLIDGLKKRFVNFLELLSIVVFHPEDLDLVAGPPSARRHHLDTVLAFSDREYWRNIS